MRQKRLFLLPIILVTLFCSVSSAPKNGVGKYNQRPHMERKNKVQLPHNVPDGYRIAQGDMLVPQGRKFINWPEGKWPEDPITGWPSVPYVLDEDVEVDRTVIESGLQHWMDNTCITFQETKNESQPHLRFIASDGGCWSYFGRQPQNGQDIMACDTIDVVTHELGHAIGFFHEQSRSDRDAYVKILWENVAPGYESEFQTEDSLNDVEYDYTSVMHYWSTEFSGNGKQTMMPWNPYDEILMYAVYGPFGVLTFRDKLLANIEYGCLDKWSSNCEGSELECLNQGYLGADCKCVCPPGTEGETCETVIGDYYPPLSCGGNVTSPSTIHTPNYPDSYNPLEYCMWWIQAPEDKKVQITFTDFDLCYHDVDADDQLFCNELWDSLEIRLEDPLTPGELYCGESEGQYADADIGPGQQFTSEGSNMFIKFYGSDWNYWRGFTADVDFV
ncbi:unnamed protein product [Meganyctiphanes norvegica]|uniref:Metalloendopeptidase n=1 Tax=Meganyctiphanes norvegica TaxID=48144 RepID=A0AAV2QYY3_MEGNR